MRTGLWKFFLVIGILLAQMAAATADAEGMSDADIKAAYYASYKSERAGNYKQAAADIEPVYKAYPAGYTVNVRLGWLYYLDGKHTNSKYYYENATKASQYSVDAKLGYTLPLMAQQEWAKVEEVCQQVIKIDYYNYLGNLRLAYAMRLGGKFGPAGDVAKKMLAIHPGDTSFLTELALDLEGTGDKKNPPLIYLDILTLDPQNSTALAKLAPASKK